MAVKKSGGSATRLTDKQERYVQELIKGKSQREAYRIAYPTSITWLDTAVDCNASKLFANATVMQRYNVLNNRLIREAEDECIVDAKQVLQELANVAFANGTDFADVIIKDYTEADADCNITTKQYKGVDAKITDDIPLDKRCAIAGIEQTKDGIRVKQHDKVKALELLGKYLKLFTDKQEVGLTGDVTIKVDITDD